MLQISRQTASFLGGIYSEGSDRSYLKAGCYEFSPTDKKTKRSSRAPQPGAARGLYQQNELAPRFGPRQLSYQQGFRGGQPLSSSAPNPPPPTPPLHLSDSSPPLSCCTLSRWLHPHAKTCHNLHSRSLPPSHPSAERVRNDSSWPASLFPDSSSLVRRAE